MEDSDPPSTSLTNKARQGLAVEVVRRAPDWNRHVDDEQLSAAARAAFESEGSEQEACEVSLLLSDDAEVRALNATWRKKDQATNVLSFPLDIAAHDHGPRHLGDIVMAYETVRREAEEKHIPMQHHATHLVVHGLLHLLGHDHEDRKDAEKMEALEAEILAGLGLPDPYCEPALEDGDVR